MPIEILNSVLSVKMDFITMEVFAKSVEAVVRPVIAQTPALVYLAHSMLSLFQVATLV